MTITEIKKELYKQKPVAEFVHAKKGSLLYAALIGKSPAGFNDYVHFQVPFSDIGDGIFMDRMPAQQLIRYLVEPSEPTNSPTTNSL